MEKQTVRGLHLHGSKIEHYWVATMHMIQMAANSMWKHILGHHKFCSSLQCMWYYWYCGHCLHPSWMLCSEHNHGFVQRWTTKECRFCTTSSNKDYWGGSRTRPYGNIWYHSIHLRKWIGHHLPASLTIDHAIGQFHVHGHKEQCFFWYSTTFIPGTGITAGEIHESLWSTLNSISPTVHTAMLAHHAEVLDDHACDSNHKKLVGMTGYLCNRFCDATLTLTEAEQHYKGQLDAAGKLAIQA